MPVPWVVLQPSHVGLGIPLRQPLDRRSPDRSLTARIDRVSLAEERKRAHGGDNIQFHRCPATITPRCPLLSAIPPTKPDEYGARSGRPLGRGTRGSDPLPMAHRLPARGRPTVRWGSLPPRKRFAVGEWNCTTARSRMRREELPTPKGGARSDVRSCGRAQRHQGFARLARRGMESCRDLDAASARPKDGNCRSESKLRT